LCRGNGGVNDSAAAIARSAASHIVSIRPQLRLPA
jgi:hypothetical protein